jgi:hypothetical protein
MTRLTFAQIEAEAPAVSKETFEVELPSGAILELPHPSELPGSVILIDDGNVEAVQRMLIAAAQLPGGEVWRTLLDSFNARQLPGILEHYMAAYGAGEPGEGIASPQRSTGSARQSKSTSRKKASTS